MVGAIFQITHYIFCKTGREKGEFLKNDDGESVIGKEHY